MLTILSRAIQEIAATQEATLTGTIKKRKLTGKKRPYSGGRGRINKPMRGKAKRPVGRPRKIR
jgi:hypothetical protein